MVFVSVDRSY